MTGERPEILLNCAISVDGRLAFAGGRTAALSGPEDRVRVQRLRSEVDGIAVGVGTVIADDPSLRVHAELLPSPPRRIPTRIVLDSHGRTPASARVLDGSIPTIFAVGDHCRRAFPAAVRVLPAGRERVEWPRLWEGLYRLGLRRVLVEGGGTVLASLLRTSPFDRMTVYVAPLVIGGTTAPSLAMGPEVADEHGVVRLRLAAVERLGSGSLLDYRPLTPRPRAEG